MAESLDLDRVITVCYCCEKTDYKIQNRQAKSLLIDYYDENICFTYPRDRKKSKMFFFSTNTC